MKDETLKRTKLGWIPEDWEVINIEDSQINIIDGDRGKNYPKQDEFLEKGFCLFLNASNVTKAGFNFDSCQFISKEKDHSLRKGKLKRNDLVLTTRGTVGNIAFFDSSVPFEIMRINSGMVILRNENPHISNRFAYIIFGSDLLQKQINRIAFGSAQPQLTVGTIRKLTIPLPPLPEQRKIAEVLSTWDKAIALTEQLIAAKQQRKKALLQQLLTGRWRFREFAHSGRKQETRYGEIPADWKIVHFQDIAKVNTETLGSKADPDHRYLYIDLSSVDRGTIVIPEERQRFADLPSRARRVLHKGDVIMATVRPNLLGFAVCDFEPQDVLCSTGFALISPQNSSDSEFIYQNLYTGTVLCQVHGLVTGSNYPAINASEVNKLKLLWPKSIEERKKIGAVLKACDTEIDLLTQKLAALQRQKKGLMQQLLTARTRVKV
ncbi:MAG: restriction endonuclease subunit S [Desulfobacterales bacterium]|nr:restriction endonuclease subunit S [Desulfobacterales bacterium]